MYAEVLSNDKYYWTHKWTLEHLLTRGFDNFLAKNDPLNNYLGRSKQNGKYNTVGGKSDDEFEKNRLGQIRRLNINVTSVMIPG